MEPASMELASLEPASHMQDESEAALPLSTNAAAPTRRSQRKRRNEEHEEQQQGEQQQHSASHSESAAAAPAVAASAAAAASAVRPRVQHRTKKNNSASSYSAAATAFSAAASAASSSSSAAGAGAAASDPKRTRRNFTDLAAQDSITLTLVFRFLDFYSLLRSRAVCASWAQASRQKVAWQFANFSINLGHVLHIPSSSVRMLRSLCLVCNLKAALPPLNKVFSWCSELPCLTSLRLEELELNTPLCDLLATYLPTLKRLDVKMCIECHEPALPKAQRLKHAAKMAQVVAGAGVPAFPQALPQLQHQLQHQHGPPPPDDAWMAPLTDDDDDDNIAAAAAAAGASSSAEETKEQEEEEEIYNEPGMVDGVPLTPAAAAEVNAVLRPTPAQLASAARYFFNEPRWPPPMDADLHCPTLHLPQLESLKLLGVHSLVNGLGMLAHAPLQTLQFRRVNTSTHSRNTPACERGFIHLMNQLFATHWAQSMHHLLMTNMHYHSWACFDFAALQGLTHLSLIQSHTVCRALTPESLWAISRIASLKEVELRVGQGACESCVAPEWWEALAAIKPLTSFSFWNPNRQAQFNAAQLGIIRAGLDKLTSLPHCRLRSIQMADEIVFDNETLLLFTRVASIERLSLHQIREMTLGAFTHLAQSLPNLVWLEIIAVPLLHSSAGLQSICRLLPRLRHLSFRFPVADQQHHGAHGGGTPKISPEAWMELASMPHLTQLHLSGYGQLPDAIIDGWCERGRRGGEELMREHQATLKRFAGFDTPNDQQQMMQTRRKVALATAAANSDPVLRASAASLSGVAWQEVRLSGWMMTYAQAVALLRSLPQLQLLSVHLLPSSRGAFAPPTDLMRPRLLFAGGDFLQRQISSYITQDEDVFK